MINLLNCVLSTLILNTSSNNETKIFSVVENKLSAMTVRKVHNKLQHVTRCEYNAASHL
jgi:hypothetical protein